jgi:hypothetical protein
MRQRASPHRPVIGSVGHADHQSVSTQTEYAEAAPMRLLAERFPLSLLWDLLDPAGPDSEDLLKHEA